jgi:hypothetical protein
MKNTLVDDLLESILAAKEHYTMMELGAGYER